jgi:hypothetical protein
LVDNILILELNSNFRSSNRLLICSSNNSLSCNNKILKSKSTSLPLISSKYDKNIIKKIKSFIYGFL